MNRPHSNSAGFTLIELIVASTLMVLVLSGVYLTFTTAVRSWRGAESNYSTYQDARLALGLLERELRAIPPDAMHLTRGSEEEIEFVTLAQPLDVETAPSERLLLVRYRYAGDRSGGELIREEAPVIGGLPLPPANPDRDRPAPVKTGKSSRFTVAEGVRAFALEYAWAVPQKSAAPSLPPPPARILSDTETLFALPEVVSATLELDDPGNTEGAGRAVFSARVTFRTPVSPMPEALRKQAGIK